MSKIFSSNTPVAPADASLNERHQPSNPAQQNRSGPGSIRQISIAHFKGIPDSFSAQRQGSQSRVPNTRLRGRSLPSRAFAHVSADYDGRIGELLAQYAPHLSELNSTATLPDIPSTPALRNAASLHGIPRSTGQEHRMKAAIAKVQADLLERIRTEANRIMGEMVSNLEKAKERDGDAN